MARAPKPVAVQAAHLTKEEIEIRQEQEKRLKGNNDKVYEPPKYLPREVKDIYMNIVEELREADILSNLDIELLSTTAYAIFRMRDARKHLDKYGSVVTGSSGNLSKSPYVQVEKDYQGIFHTGCLQLGLSPSSRAKLALMAAEKEEDEDDGF